MQHDHSKAFDNKVLAAVGNWEPLFHRLRGSGGYHVDEPQRYAREHSEEMVGQLADEGINVVLMHYYKGMGFEFEKAEMENTRRFIESCHRHDIMVGTYTQWGSIWAEVIFSEHPDALDYCQKDRFGRPSMYSETYLSYHRYRTCVSSVKFMHFLKEMVRYSVEHVGTDMVYFDNLGQNPCYCDGCQKGFIEFLRKKYPTPQALEARCGLRSLEYVRLPFGIERNGIDSVEIVGDPVMQEWIEFRCNQLYEALKGVDDFMAALSRRVPLAFNPPILYGDNAPLVWGTDWFRIMKTSRFFYSEDPNVTQITADGRLISQHRVFKTACVMKNSCFRFHSHRDYGDKVEPELIALSEAAMLNDGNLATVKYYGTIARPLAPKKKQYIKYFREHERDYAGVEQVSEVGVYKNFETLAWAWPQVYPKLTVTEQLLIQSGTQFSYVLNDSFGDLFKYKALVLAETWCLSQEYAEKIADYVKNGGSVLVIGKTGTRDLWFRNYGDNVLAKALGRTRSTGSQATFIALGAGAGGGFRASEESIDGRWQFGKGRICWIPEAQVTANFNPKVFGQIWMIENTFWDVPANWKEILDGLDWVLGGRWIPLQVPARVMLQVSRRTGGKELLMHVLNYDSTMKVADLSLRISKELGEPVSVMWRTPEDPIAQELTMSISDASVLLTLPAFEYHGTIIYKF